MPKQPPDPAKLTESLLSEPEKLRAVIKAGLFSATVDDRYIHWDKLRYRQAPDGVTHEQWWSAIKLARNTISQSLTLLDADKKPFRIASPDPLQRQLSELDRDLSGRVPVPEQIRNPATRDAYVVSALIEEAITSSQLEGATSTRKVAAEMLRSGRKPRDRAERMIFNNFDAMNLVRRLASEPITPDVVMEIHRRVTQDTLNDPADAGRLRTADDIVVEDAADQTQLHVPPAAAELQARVAKMCDFANEASPTYYIHPIVRASLLHFWLAYDHPFVDGNGRTARALFYWSMLRSGYWLTEYISISQILKKAPAKYARAYLYAESDENDATYFVMYQLTVLRRAIDALHKYVRRKMREINKMQSLARRSQAFNYRQMALLGHALGDKYSQFTVSSHANSHNVSPQTARNDLVKLVELGLLTEMKAGRGSIYYTADDLETRLANLGEKASNPNSKPAPKE